MMWWTLTILAGAIASPCEKVGIAYGDVAGIPNAGYTNDADGCQMTCGNDFKCKSYTWKENSSPMRGACWHFPSAEEAQTMEPSAVSGPKTCKSPATSAGATLGNIGDAASAGINEAVDSMNGEVKAAATAVSNAVPTVPPLPSAEETATAISDALPTVPPVAATPATPAEGEFQLTTAAPKAGISAHIADLKDKIKKSFDVNDSFTANMGGPGFWTSLVLVVVAAFSLRVGAHYFFNDAQNAKREEKNRKAKSSAAEKQAKRDDEEEAAKPPTSAITSAIAAGQGAVQQMMMSGQLYQQPMVVSQSQSPQYQVLSPSGTAQPISYVVR